MLHKNGHIYDYKLYDFVLFNFVKLFKKISEDDAKTKTISAKTALAVSTKCTLHIPPVQILNPILLIA